MGVTDLTGIVAILPTPLTRERRLDEAGVRHLVASCAEEGFDGATVLGSTGEFPFLSFEEKCRVMAVAAETGAGRIPVIGSASAHGTDEAVALARAARSAGCDAVLAILPLYYALDFAAVERHFETLAREGGLPVFFYHYREVAGLALTPRQIERIARIDGVVGAKITTLSKTFLRAVIRRTRPHGFRVFTGTTFLAERCLAFGGAGVFCPLPLLAPDEVRALFESFERGARGRARALQNKLRRAIPLMNGSTTPPALLALGLALASSAPFGAPGGRPRASHGLLKEALRLCGHPIENTVKRPNDEVTPAESALVEKTLHALGWLGGDGG
jgi:4-hydroxy-tetrahydrodipicolinate synthase